MNKKVRLPNMYEVVLLLALFLVIMTSSIIVFNLELQLSLFIVWFIMIGMGLYLGHTYNELQSSLAEGIHKGIEAIFIIIAVGALIGTWIAGGIVPSIIYYGMAIIHPSIFLLATLIICSITSLATGTSFGTVGTAGIAMMAIGISFGIPAPLVAGAVISGAYFGDKLSPLSDMTVLTASLSKVDIVDHIKSMLHVSVPSYIIAAILFLIVGFQYGGDESSLAIVEENMAAIQDVFHISWYMLVPMIVVIILLAMRKPAVPSIAFGALLGVIWSWLFQKNSFMIALKSSYDGVNLETGNEFMDLLLSRGGIASMIEVVLFMLLALGLGGLLDKIGVMQVLQDKMSIWVKESTGRLTLSTIGTAFFGNLFGSAGYVSIITGSKMTEQNYDRLNVDRKVLSRNTEAGGTLTAAMVPWGDNGIYMAAMLGVSTFAYLPFMWFAFISIIISIIYGYTGKFIWRTDNNEKKNNILDESDTKDKMIL